MPLTPGTRLGPYEILAPLGAGGMGEVYRARDIQLNRNVAVKVLPAALAGDALYMARFEREAQVLASLNHPNIATVYGIELGALVMELVEGADLSGPLPLEEALPIARQIAVGLEAAHEKGIVHRDLKPANIKITPAGVVKLLDFGLAKSADDFAATAPGSSPTMSPTMSLAMTQAGMILGTAGYMAPEQARGHVVDQRADIWAFGVVLLEMLTGKPAFPGDTVTDILASVVKLEADWSALPPSTPAAIRKLIARCLVKDRTRRLQAIGEARLAIEDYLADPAAGTEPAAVSSLPPARRPWLWMALSGTLLAALAVIGAVHFRETPAPERVLRYSIPTPERGTIHTFALSPDGRYLAIATTTLEGRRRLWLQPLDTQAPRELHGTEDALYPFWSPNSRSIGFFAGGKLKRAGIDGGPPLVLCDAPPPVRGGTWSRDDVILFAAGSGSAALQKVAASGGVPVAVTKRLGRRIYPFFLPDGQRFFHWFIGTGQGQSGQGQSEAGIDLGSLDDQPPRPVLNADSSVSWAPPPPAGGAGYLMFQRDGILMAQPLDAKTLRPSGDLFPVAEQVSLQGSYAQASVSQTGVLVYWTGAPISSSQLVWYDRSGKTLGNVGAPAAQIGLALSPDEKTVAVARGKASSRVVDTDVWLHELSRGVDIRFTLDASGSRTPVWSPDGRRMVYCSNRGGNPNLYLKDTSGTGRDERLLPPGTSRFSTDWSKDGRTLIYQETGKGYDLWTVNMQGDRKPVPFANSEFNETQGQFSPDGRWMAYSSDESGRFEVYVRPFPEGAGKWRISTNGGELPRWRGDGKEIFYIAPDRKLMAVPVRAVPGAQPSLTAEAPLALFETHIAPTSQGFNNYPYAAAADGQRFLAITGGVENTDTPLTVVVNWLAAIRK